MKIFLRCFLFLALCSCCYTASTGIDDHVGYIVGNNYGVGPSGRKWRETGPNGDVTIKFRYGSVTNNLVFYRPTQLGPAGVSLKWAQLGSASGGGFLYCSRGGSTSGGPVYIRNKMVDSGKSYGGHRLFKTSVPGLYHTLAISSIWSAYIYADISPPGMYIGDSTSQSSNWRGEGEQILYWSCNNADTKSKYWAVGGVMQAFAIELYTDTDFNPTTNQRVTLSGTDNCLYLFRAYSADIGINDYSYFLKIDFDLTGIVLTDPTCFTATFSDSSVSDSTVKMGNYTPAQIKNGTTAIPFDIILQNCIRVRNIETKLKSNKVGSVSKELLANTLIRGNVAKGVGVLIKGLKNTKSAQMVLKPNDATSTYRDYKTEDDTTEGIFPDQGNGTSQPPHSRATLKRDGNIAIEPGDFKATSTFRATYP